MAVNDLVIKLGTLKSLEDSGAAVTDTSFAAADQNDLTPSDDAGFPFLKFVLIATWATSTGIEDGAVRLYSRKLNIDGTNDAAVPDATYPHDFVGSFVPDAVTSLQRIELSGVERAIEQDESFYIENATGQTISSTWDLTVTPYTFGPATT
jgi:hypothetical protein